MSYILSNAGPILAAALASLLFGWGWMQTVGRREGTVSVRLAILAFAAEFWLASILAGALILAPRQAGAWTMALATAVVIWIGFVLPALVVTLAAMRRGWPAIFAACAHWLGAMLIQAAVLQAIGLVPPPSVS